MRAITSLFKRLNWRYRMTNRASEQSTGARRRTRDRRYSIVTAVAIDTIHSLE
ncbi:hypothetical protein [Microbacterium awajiense]|uniref:hypothetical protein n=1 Tax=Microbacterium awajiense TaxID=415214 RepID=UPI0031D204DF